MHIKYAWLITKDYHPEGEPGTYQNAVGIMGPHDASDDYLHRLHEGEGREFQMRYGDPDPGDPPEEDICYEGRIIMEGDHPALDLRDEHFAPLRDFGEGNVGATEIYYKDDSGNWVQI